MSKPDVIAAFMCDKHGGYQSFLERDLKRAGIPLIKHISSDFSWRKRILWTRDVAKDNPESVVVFLDAWDMILMGTQEELASLGLEKGITLAGAKTCWPDASLAAAYDLKNPGEKSPWKYVNSNPMAGLGKNVSAAIEWGWERFPLKTNTKTTQDQDVCEEFYTALYLGAPKEFNIRIDTKCELGQIFYGSLPGELHMENYRVTNLIHGTKPIFLHANGREIVPEGLLKP